METTDFSISILVNKDPHEVFKAITNVRDWWSGYYSEEFNGSAEKLNDEFSFRAGGGAHYSKQKLIRVIPDKRITWLVTESDLNFLEKPDEWTGTSMVFEIKEKDGKTQLTFTHKGLTPEAECYDSCAPAWTLYIQNKLIPLINNNTVATENKSYSASILVDQDPSIVFRAIKNFRAWWSEDIEGNTDKLNEEFLYHYKDIHLCKIKLIEEMSDKKLVYKVLENEFNFVKDKSEWVNTRLIFEINSQNGKIMMQFTHEGLIPEYECYDVCNEAWSTYIKKSLYNLIINGKGNPNPKDKDGFNAELAEKWKLLSAL